MGSFWGPKSSIVFSNVVEQIRCSVRFEYVGWHPQAAKLIIFNALTERREGGTMRWDRKRTEICAVVRLEMVPARAGIVRWTFSRVHGGGSGGGGRLPSGNGRPTWRSARLQLATWP